MLTPFSVTELGLDLSHKITLELPNRYKIVFNNDGTSKSYEYTEFKHLVKDEPKPKYNNSYWWITSPYTHRSSNRLHCSQNLEGFGAVTCSVPNFINSDNFTYHIEKGYFKCLGVATKKELKDSNPMVGTVVYCEEDNCSYMMTSIGWKPIGNDFCTPSDWYWEQPVGEHEIQEKSMPTFHEESYWEYVEVKK